MKNYGERSMASIDSYFKPKETVVPAAKGSLSRVIPSSSIQLDNQMVSKVTVDGEPKLPSWIETIARILCSFCFPRSNRNWKNAFVSKCNRLCTVHHWCEWSMFLDVRSAEAVCINRSKSVVRTKLDNLQILPWQARSILCLRTAWVHIRLLYNVFLAQFTTSMHHFLQWNRLKRHASGWKRGISSVREEMQSGRGIWLNSKSQI